MEEMTSTCAVTGLPADCRLIDLEGIILPRISGRIVAIGLREQGTAVIEFARHADAGARACRASNAPIYSEARTPAS